MRLRVDSKGRILLPEEIRKELGGIVILERTKDGFLLKKEKTFLEEFKEVISSDPPRTGEPENWPPSEMKKIWVRH